MSEYRDKALRAISAFDQLLAAMDEGRGDAFLAAKQMIETMIQSPHDLQKIVRGMRELAIKEVGIERNGGQYDEGDYL